MKLHTEYFSLGKVFRPGHVVKPSGKPKETEENSGISRVQKHDLFRGGSN